MTSDTFFDDDGGDQAVALVAPLTDRVNNEPAILKGLSATETFYAALLFFPLWIVIGGFLAVVIGSWKVVMLCAVIGPMASVWVSAGFLAKLKRNRPDHYYLHAFGWWRHRFGLGRSPFIARHGAWDLGRSMPLIAAKTQSLAQRLRSALGL
jgi:conjugative transfer region protein (TIGR03750 family)